jgi:MraZ protein
VGDGGKKVLYLLLNDLKSNCLNTIVGTYECKADNKGRLMIPAPLKKQLHEGLDQGFVLKRSVFQQCLELYPMAEWEKMMNKLNKLNRFVKKNNDFIRAFTAGVRVVEMDAAGRVLIPKDLAVFGGIEGEVVLSSAVNIVEIWNKERYEASINVSDDDFASLAEDVMGNIMDDEDGIS